MFPVLRFVFHGVICACVATCLVACPKPDPQPIVVPEVVGMLLADAQIAMNTAGLALGRIEQIYSSTVAVGNVVCQEPLAGVLVTSGTAMNVSVSKGVQPVIVPNVVSMTHESAQATIVDALLQVGTATRQYDLETPIDKVISQDPSAESLVPPGTPVDLVVSEGCILCPLVVNKTRTEAERSIAASGLIVGNVIETISHIRYGNVVGQEPNGNSGVLPGTPVNLLVSAGMTTVPDVVGRTKTEAQQIISHWYLRVGTQTEVFSPTVEAGHVMSQEPLAGASGAYYTQVNLILSGGPLPITSIEELQQIGRDPAHPLRGNYVLCDDIDASVTATWNQGAGFIPIRDAQDYSFRGTLDGQGHSIMSLTVANNDLASVGLFAALTSDAVIKNLKLEQCVISGKEGPGLDADVIYVGGIAGTNSGRIENCSVTGTVFGYNAGGLVGSTEGTVNRCYAICNVYSRSYAGGLAAQNAGEITESYSAGEVYGDTAGGLLAQNNSIVEECYSICTGVISHGKNAGGLTGENRGWISRCFSTSRVIGDEDCFIGGLVGYSSSTSALVADSYWDIETSGQTTSGAGVGVSTEGMMTRATFKNWNFTQIWQIAEGKTYPFLRFVGLNAR